MNKPQINKIFLDMDGVIADFQKRYIELYNMLPKEAEANKKFNHFFEDFIQHNHFATLDIMPGAYDLIAYLRTLPIPTEILSSTASEKRDPLIRPQKLQWLESHAIGFKAILVPGAKHKAQYATPDSILIDDMERNCEEFRKAGGFAILHKDVPTTLAILKLYV
jgi:beta-phosphoglucomutase-like phosphatase (HAD superfamily)